jgi:hypothetical protein
LFADISEVAVVAGERLNAGSPGQHFASDGKINVFHAVHEPGSPLQIFLLEPGSQRLFRRVGLLRACRG